MRLTCPAFQQSPQVKATLTCTSLRASGELGTFRDSYFVPRKLWAAKESGAGRDNMRTTGRQRKGGFRTSTELGSGFVPPLCPLLHWELAQNLHCGPVNSGENNNRAEKFALVETYFLRRWGVGGDSTSLHSFAPLPPSPARKRQDRGKREEEKNCSPGWTRCLLFGMERQVKSDSGTHGG